MPSPDGALIPLHLWLSLKELGRPVQLHPRLRVGCFSRRISRRSPICQHWRADKSAPCLLVLRVIPELQSPDMWSHLLILSLFLVACLAGTNPAGKAFLEENAKKEGVKVTASGLQYRVLKSGADGAKSPQLNSNCQWTGKRGDPKDLASLVCRPYGDGACINPARDVPGGDTWAERMRFVDNFLDEIL
eukprot:g62288.t1